MMNIKEYESQNKVLDILKKCVEKINKVQEVITNLNIDDISMLHKEKNKSLKIFNFEDLSKSISVEISEINYLINKGESEWNKFNEQYQNYYINRLNGLKSNCERFNGYNTDVYNDYIYSQLYDIVNAIYHSTRRNSTFDLYEHFKYGDKNYILFGKNGAGKTTLLNKISSEFLKSNTVVLKATRNIKYNDNMFYYQNDINLLSAIKHDEDGKSLFLLGKLLVDKDYEQLKQGINPEKTIENDVIAIFNQLGLDRKLVVKDHGSLFLGEKGITPYLITEASDGERSSIFIILSVLLSPLNSFVFIDEPENHLNGALMSKLFDLLERARPDIKFVFATHNIQFIQSRQNVELIYLEKTNEQHQWNFKKFEDFENLPLEIVLNIEGTNDNVIFCEGEDRASLDCKLYEMLFPNYEIVSAHGCENVEKQTEFFNANKLIFKKEAFGIVDNDFRTNEEIEKLKTKNIKVLAVNEIENLLIAPCCLECMLDVIATGKTIDEIKIEIISKINSKIDAIKQDFATKLLRKIQLQNKLKKVSDVENDLDEINSSNKIQFLEKYKNFEDNLISSIKLKDYEQLMKMVPAKMLLLDVSKMMGFVSDKYYVNNLFIKINEDNELKKQLLKIINF